ncbi:peptide-methionine (R)-S-oxide reductase MsrB [Chelatococcus reniformis]|uniref:peptide-methionine (R)-S-oxide reductase n=1 Tax=Chelatococcus reniformis TaxID=1494448 RepID=A0A916U9M5_9HYPH|nr:peptide-methionine (R)-S-oxide reductase MsrB [Chelatococcus reniformis]GGC64832.1 putative methionine sulfoxide reductase [Chelatococcus reniformis]
MLARRHLLLGGALGLMATLARPTPSWAAAFQIAFSDVQWRRRLSPDRYAVLRQSATEPPYSSPLLGEHRRGTFACAGCARDLFSSATKFDSGTGWPSFWAPLHGAVGTAQDGSHGMRRTAVHCGRCGGHLGHVFDDGPKPTRLRYCMNGLALTFQPRAA